MLNWFKRPETAVVDDPAPEVAPEPSRPVVLAALQSSGTYAIKERKWVVWDNRVGICHRLFMGQLDADPNSPWVQKAEIHLVNDKGETVSVIVDAAATLRLARHGEIPAARRPESAVRAALRGYV